jgi:hypothetical protein
VYSDSSNPADVGDPHDVDPFQCRAAAARTPSRHKCGYASWCAAAVTEAGDVSDMDLVRARGCPLGQRVGGWVIHFPSVVYTSSPNTFEA